MDLEHITCPICGANGGEEIVSCEGGKLVKCGCGLMYACDRVTLEHLGQLQASYVPSGFFKTFANRIRQAHSDLSILERHSDIGYLFDVAAGSGAFADSAKQRGWSVTGNDLSAMCVMLAKRVFDVEILNRPLEYIVFPEEEITAFSMMNAIEHLMNPVEDLNRMHDALICKGKLLVRAPVVSEERLKEYHQLPQHFFNYTEETIKALFKKCDFKIIYYKEEDDTMIVVGEKC